MDLAMRERSAKSNDSRGAALLLTMWAVAVLSVSLLALGRIVGFDSESESLEQRRFVARQLALTGLAIAEHPQVKSGDPVLCQVLDASRKFESRIESENGRANINSLLIGGRDRLLRRIFVAWGVSPANADVAVD